MNDKITTKWAVDFFDLVEPIRLLEPLAAILGAIKPNEPFVFTYADAVRMAGHSCPAVSGAYKVTQKALSALYPDSLPVRGEIRILLKGRPEDMAYGPQAQVFSLITGASTSTGFKGLGGKFSRYKKLVFDPDDIQFNTYIFERMDTGSAVKLVYNPQALPDIPRLNTLTPLVISGKASNEESDEFHSLWQGKVRMILLEEGDFPGLIELEELKDFQFPEL